MLRLDLSGLSKIDDIGVATLRVASRRLEAAGVAVDQIGATPEVAAALADAPTSIAAPERVGDIVNAVDPERVESIVIETERATKTLAATAVRLRGTVDEARTGIAKASESVDAVARKAEATLGHADDAAKELTDAVGKADTIVDSSRADLRVTLHNLRRVSEDAKALVEALRENPSLLLRRPRRPRKRRR